MGNLSCFVSSVLYEFRWSIRTLMVFLQLVGMVGVEGRVRSVGVHGECLLGALRRKKEEVGSKVDVDVESEVLRMEDMIMYFLFVIELNNSSIFDVAAEAV